MGTASKLYEEEKIIREKVQHMRKGKTFKSYKDMCEYFGIEVKTYTSKKAQMKIIESYLDLERNGNKFTVLEVHKEPREIIDKRKNGNNNIYTKFIEIILLQFLSEQSDDTLISTKTKLYNILGMVNDNYIGYYTHPDYHEKQLKNKKEGVATFDIEQFYQRANAKLSSILESALKSLQRKFLILYSKSTVLVTQVYNERGTSYVEEKRLCTEDEEKIVLGLKRKTLLEMGYTNNGQLTPATYKIFSKKLNKKLNEQFGCTYGYTQLKIIYNKEHVIQAIPMEEISLNKKLLNEATQQGTLNTIMNTFSKQQMKDRNMLMPQNTKEQIIQELDEKEEDFKELQELMIDYFLNIGRQKADS